MPWNVRGIVETRMEFVRKFLREEETMSALCREFNISRPTGYLWIKRYKETRKPRALLDRSHSPQTIPHKTSPKLERQATKLRRREGWGAKKIHEILKTKKNVYLPIRTINRIIERNGLLVKGDRNRPALKRFERSAPNDLWQTDLKGAIGQGQVRCEPLTILDDHSRFALGVFPVLSSLTEPIQAAFKRTFERYGIPRQMLMDHGVPWWTVNNYMGLTRLSVWLLKQDIELIFSGINHPQTQGKIERFHRTLAHSVYHHGTPEKFANWSPLFKRFVRTYNYERPHEALNMATPASRYRKSVRSFNPTPKTPDYPQNSKVIKVDELGRFRFNSKRLFVSEALAGEYVRLEQLENSLVVFYRHSAIREIDLRTGASYPFRSLS